MMMMFTLLLAGGIGAEAPKGKVLFVYDEVKSPPEAFPGYFRDSLASEGVPFDEAVAADMNTKDLSSYDRIVVYGMVQAFNMKSPLRDWLKTKPDLGGKKVSLFVTANRWYLKNLYGQLTTLLKKGNAEVIDAVSMATRDMDTPTKVLAVKDHVARLK